MANRANMAKRLITIDNVIVNYGITIAKQRQTFGLITREVRPTIGDKGIEMGMKRLGCLLLDSSNL